MLLVELIEFLGIVRFISLNVGGFCGKITSTCRVDKRYRIVLDKGLRRQVSVEAGDLVILEPIDRNSFRAVVMRFGEEPLEDDPAWKVLHTPIRPERYIPPEELEEIMEEETWR